MSAQPLYDVLCVGNYTKDTIISPKGTKYVDGGAVNYAAHALARLGVRTAVVTHLAQEDERVVKRLAEVGVDCFPTYTSHSTCMQLEYPTEDPDIRTLSVPHTAGAITASDVSGIRARRAIIGSSFRGEVGLDVIRAIKQAGIPLALDVQGFVRVLGDGELGKQPWPEMAETLSLVDIVKADAVEAEFLTGEYEVRRAAAMLRHLGPSEIVLTHKDGLLIHADGTFYELKFHPTVLNGRSGRGDTCLGTYAGMRLSEPARVAGVWAAALTSLKMEKLGPFDRTRSDVEQLIHAKYNGSSGN